MKRLPESDLAWLKNTPIHPPNMYHYRQTPPTSSSSSHGIGFVGLLTITFITLKLTGVISWPWLWILSPLWISLIIVFLIILVCALIYFNMR